MGPPDIEPIGIQLARTARLVSRAFEQTLESAGGSTPVWLILLSLKSQHHSAQRAIAESVGIDSATLTHHLNRMEKAGLVTRQRDPDNRRVHRVELTTAGEAMFERCLVNVVAFDSRLRGDLTAAELVALSTSLSRLRDHVGDSRAVQGPVVTT